MLYWVNNRQAIVNESGSVVAMHDGAMLRPARGVFSLDTKRSQLTPEELEEHKEAIRIGLEQGEQFVGESSPELDQPEYLIDP